MDRTPAATTKFRVPFFFPAVQLNIFHSKVSKYSKLPTDEGLLCDKTAVLRDMTKWTTVLGPTTTRHPGCVKPYIIVMKFYRSNGLLIQLCIYVRGYRLTFM
jgi:hypothetical protein